MLGQWYPFESTVWLIDEVYDEWKHEQSGCSILRTQNNGEYVDFSEVIRGKHLTNRIATVLGLCVQMNWELYIMGHGFGAKPGRPIAGNEFITIQNPQTGELLRTSYVDVGNVLLEAIGPNAQLTIYLYMCYGAGHVKRFGPRLSQYLASRGYNNIIIMGSSFELSTGSMKLGGAVGAGVDVRAHNAFQIC